MNKEVKRIYKQLIKIIHYMNLVLKKEKLALKKDKLELKINTFLKNNLDINILLDEINLCIDENIESQKFLYEIKEYLLSLNKVNFNTKENLYYLSTADKYFAELLEIYNSRKSYLNEKYYQYINLSKGIYYFNPKIQPRNEINEKIKLYKLYFKNTNPKNSK
ncbi:MAG: hypothetical protein IJO32_05940 [Bacilli bacterium]|nr:hypothetical protein [Bacilli bacterium]